MQDQTPFRVWPGVAIVVLQWLAVFGTGVVAPATPVQFFGMVGGPLIGVLLLFLWWLFASRAPWLDRLVAVGLMIVAFIATFKLAHESTPMGMVVYGIPILCLAFVAWAIVARGWPSRRRRVAMVVTILVACGAWALVRTEGVDGDMSVDFAWRWGATAEDRLLASAGNDIGAAPGSVVAQDPDIAFVAEWPGFRGAERDGIVTGVRIATDWTASPPQEVWRRPIGPGWSSFAVAGDRLYTQEQRGEDEIVACYSATTGEPVWMHRDRARFWEAMAGAGPRATPTLHEGRVYALGATGILNVLEATDGSRVWSRDAAADTAASVPDWGFSSSPLIVDDIVVIHTGAPDGKAVVAYDIETGEPRWYAPAGPLSYSSVQLTTIDGVRQLILLTGDGATSLAPHDGTVLWEHAWPMEGARIVQPAFTADGDVLIGTGFGMGLRRIAISGTSENWSVEQRWTSTGVKPYFNDLVVHRGHVYGFDGRILACLDLATGERVWKGGRYGNGQMMLLADQDLLLVLSDRGEIALVEADPAGFSEIARVPAIQGKTWNHPVLVGGVLYVRNGEEMAAFRLLTS